MSRTPGASCLQDVRSIAILQDYVISTNNCAPGQAEQLARRNRLGGVGYLDNCEPPACGYDRGKDIVSVIAASMIIATAVGIVHTFAVFIPSYAIEYDAGYLELTLVACITYFVMLLTSCMANPIIEYAGHKLTAIFGMILIFVGILVDSQVFHIICLYLGNILFIGVGAGLAYATSMTLPADLFRKKLVTGLMLVNIAGCIGTIFYTWMGAFVLSALGYKWAKLLQAVLVLVFTLTVHVFPKTRLMYASGCDPSQGHGPNDMVRECVYKAATTDVEQKRKVAPNCEDSDESEQRNLLCVCVCDLRLYGDRSFILYACLVMVATFTIHYPYLTILSYAETVGARLSFWYITIFCIGSIGGRCAFIGNLDFTFAYNRTVFQGAIMVTGIMWIVINWALTFGWIMVCCAILGLLEGIICVVSARLAIGTIPKRWMSGAWVTCIIFHAIGMFAMTLFVAVISINTFHYTFCYVITGVIQIIVSLLAVLLPSLEDDFPAETPAAGAQNTNYQTGRLQMSSQGFRPYSTYRPSIDLDRLCGSHRARQTSSYMSSSSRAAPVVPQSGQYKCQCAICKKFGCIPGCLPDCTPGGSLDKNCP